MAGDADEAHMCVVLFFYYCIYALGFHPTKEPISAKAKAGAEERRRIFCIRKGRSAAEEKSHGF